MEVERRQLSRSRTGLMVVGSVGAAAFVVFTIIDSALGGDPPPPSGGSDIRIPLP